MTSPDFVSVHIVFDGVTIPVEYNMPFTLKQSRGVDPYFFSITLSHDSINLLPVAANLKDGAKCAFRFDTPAANGGRSQLDWSWWLVRVEPGRSDTGTFIVTFADERWKMDHRRYSLSYNIQWPDGSYRSETTPLGRGKPWTALEAIKDAAEQMGYKLDTTRVHGSKFYIQLPNNLGNSQGGGWVFETPSEIFKPMLSVLDCDLIVKADSTLAIVDRTGDSAAITKMQSYRRIDDSVDTGFNGWELPKEIRLGLEVKAEAVIESKQPITASGTPTFDIPENVMPRPELADRSPVEWWNAGASGIADTEWEEIQTLLEGLGFVTTTPRSADVMICRNWFLPNIIPLNRAGEFDEIVESADPTENSIRYQTKLWCDAALRMCYRRTYRITYPTNAQAGDPLVPNIRNMAGLRFGRLSPGGESISKGSVFCSWSEESTHALNFTKNSDPLSAVFSDNHKFDPQRAAPFTVRWVSQNGNELIYELTPADARRIGQAKIYPGIFTAPLTYGDWFTLTADNYLEGTEIQGEFWPQFDFRIYFSGRLIREDKRSGITANIDNGKIKGRQLIITLPMFEDGAIAGLDIRSNAVTANYGYTKDQMGRDLGDLASRWPERLLNVEQITKFAQDLRDKIKRKMMAGRSGGIRVAGVQPMQDGCMTSGDIHEMSVVIGDPDPWSITTQCIVLPGIPAFSVDPERADGDIPNLIDQE